ncbi:MAG: 5-formyltetrahydrofolate cyclo-ligase [bacterium]|nr:5-formyltetrahydrofolate cyclo-ligase [bacterium]
MNKFELRKIQKNIRKSLNIKELSEKILDKLFALPEFVSAENIFTYISFGSEINTYRILNLKSKNY